MRTTYLVAPRIVTVTPRLSHSQVWSKRSASTRLTNRFDDLDDLRFAQRRKATNVRRYQSRGTTVQRVA